MGVRLWISSATNDRVLAPLPLVFDPMLPSGTKLTAVEPPVLPLLVALALAKLFRALPVPAAELLLPVLLPLLRLLLGFVLRLLLLLLALPAPAPAPAVPDRFVLLVLLVRPLWLVRLV
jgi:hypothetical protein